jgi:hypothetical protein
MGTNSADDYTRPLNQFFDQVKQGLDQVINAFKKIVDEINDNRFLLGPIMYAIRSGLDQVHTLLGKVYALMQYAVEHQVPVVSLIEQSFNWVNNVEKPVSDMSSIADESLDPNLAYWSGGAADAYHGKAAAQKDAIDDTVTKANFISGWLMEIAKSNVEYMKELASVVANIAGAFAQAVIDAASVMDIQSAVDTLAGTVGKLVEAGINDLVAAGQRFVAALSDARDIDSQVGDHTKLPGGKWPQAVAS